MNLPTPQNIEAERSVLGSCLIDPNAITYIQDYLTPEDFYDEANRHIYRAVLEILMSGGRLDTIILTSHLRRHGLLQDIGGAAYLTGLTDTIGTSSYVESYASEVKDAADRRQALQYLQEAYSAVVNSPDAASALNIAESKLLALTTRQTRSEWLTSPELARALESEIDRARITKELPGIRTGIKDLDDVVTSFSPGNLVILAARPSIGKCLGKGTKVVMSDGTLKAVEALSVGDELLGPDSKPRKILSLARGREQMYWVRQSEGIDYRVNESHVLSLKTPDGIVNIPLKEYLALSDESRAVHQGYKVPIDLPRRHVPIKPYLFGAWLAKGIHAVNPEHPLEFIRTLMELGISHNVSIPDSYLYSSRPERLKLLAGLIDFTGRLADKPDTYEITTFHGSLSKQIKYVADSLGYNTRLSSTRIDDFTQHRVTLTGDVAEIPVRLTKRATSRPESRGWQSSDIKIERDAVDDYYGFTLDKDGLFLLEDMTVTHNTAMALCIAFNNLFGDSKRNIAMFSLEMSALEIFVRMLALDVSSNTPGMTHMRNMALLSDRQVDRAKVGLQKLEQMPLWIDDNDSLTINTIRSRARALAVKHPLDLIIIDYLTLITPDKDDPFNDAQRLAIYTRKLKGLARELNCPILLLSQLNREVEKRPNRTPQLSDLRSSGGIEQDADKVMLLHREGFYDPHTEFPRKAKVIVAKNRQGPTGEVDVNWNPDRAKFTDWADDERY